MRLIGTRKTCGAESGLLFAMPSIAQLEALLREDPNDAFVLYGLAQEHAKRADGAGEAIAYYDQCLRADPGYCYAYFHKARVQWDQQGDRQGAIATARAGLAAARARGDFKAQSEIQGLLDEWDA